MPIHCGSQKYNHFTVSSPIATRLSQAVGAAYSLKINKKDACVVTYFGDGSASDVLLIWTRKFRCFCKPSLIQLRTPLRPNSHENQRAYVPMEPQGASSIKRLDSSMGQSNTRQRVRENVDILIKASTKDLGFINGKPVVTYIVYKSLLHWKVFEVERTSVFDRLIIVFGTTTKLRGSATTTEPVACRLFSTHFNCSKYSCEPGAKSLAWVSDYVPAYRLQIDSEKLRDLKFEGWKESAKNRILWCWNGCKPEGVVLTNCDGHKTLENALNILEGAVKSFNQLLVNDVSKLKHQSGGLSTYRPARICFWKEVADVYEIFLVGYCGRALPSNPLAAISKEDDESLEMELLDVLGDKILLICPCEVSLPGGKADKDDVVDADTSTIEAKEMSRIKKMCDERGGRHRCFCDNITCASDVNDCKELSDEYYTKKFHKVNKEDKRRDDKLRRQQCVGEF
ncbi:protein MON2 homolog isoform X2 [Tanacetum coccineum]